jgi:uncharacterized membrane protein HdeD (DUF308 family)
MISLTDVAWFVGYVLVAAGVFALLDLLVRKCPWLPEDWKPTVRYILLVLGVFVLIGIIISLIPGNGPMFRR